MFVIQRILSSTLSPHKTQNRQTRSFWIESNFYKNNTHISSIFWNLSPGKKTAPLSSVGTVPHSNRVTISRDKVSLVLKLWQGGQEGGQEGGHWTGGGQTSYSIIFIDIIFYPESSILLQIIRVTQVTFWIHRMRHTWRAVCPN